MQAYFSKFKNNLELDPTLAAKVSTRHLAVREYLENNHPGFKDAKLIGSLQRQTRINPGNTHLFDIDIIVVMVEFYNWLPAGQGISPQQALNDLHSTINDSARYNAMDPVQDAPTVTLTAADDLRVELVPAYLDMIGYDSAGNQLGPIGRGYWVVKDGRWQMADYDHEADWITAQNRLSAEYLVPAIKMLKAIKGNYFSELDSFPLEILAANTIPGTVVLKQLLGGGVNWDDLLLDFFNSAPAKLSGPIQVPGGKSAPTVLDQFKIASLTQKFNNISNYIKQVSALTNQSNKVSFWKKLCGEHFPTSIS